VLLKAVAYFLDQRGLACSPHNSGTQPLGGAGYTDVDRRCLPAKEILLWISVPLVAIRPSVVFF